MHPIYYFKKKLVSRRKSLGTFDLKSERLNAILTRYVIHLGSNLNYICLVLSLSILKIDI